MTRLCHELYRNFDHSGWNEDDLATLPGKELVFLAKNLGLAHSGTKEKLIVRILSCRIVRARLAPFTDDPSPVAEKFKRESLRWMCEQANLWKSGNKIQLAAVLLRWRNQCRKAGQKYLQECIDHTRSQPLQLELI